MPSDPRRRRRQKTESPQSVPSASGRVESRESDRRGDRSVNARSRAQVDVCVVEIASNSGVLSGGGWVWVVCAIRVAGGIARYVRATDSPGRVLEC